MKDINNIFNLFTENEEFKDSLIDFSEHPLIWINGFNKILNNNLFLKNLMYKIFNNDSAELDYNDIERAGKYIMYNKAWNYIKNIDIKNKFHNECLKLKSTKQFIDSLESTILFFESLEEYEKCFYLKQIENKVKKFLN